MSLLTWAFKLPLQPLAGVIKLGEVIGQETERQLRDPARVRRELEDAQRRYDAGEISDEDLAQVQNAAVGDLIGEPTPAARGGGQDRS